MLVNKILERLLSQRRDLLQSQELVSDHLAGLEQRLILVQMKYQRRLGHYQERVATLEAENRHLSKEIKKLSRNGNGNGNGHEPVVPFGTGRVNLRGTSLLLRA